MIDHSWGSVRAVRLRHAMWIAWVRAMQKVDRERERKLWFGQSSEGPRRELASKE